jgi:hypothetical protein
MTVYGRSDITFVELSGSGHSHIKKKTDAYMTVTCAVCEPELRKDGWVTDVRNVELTPDEVRDLENAQQEIARFESMKVAENAREAAAAVRAAGSRSR